MVVHGSTREYPRLQDSEVQAWRRQQVYRVGIKESTPQTLATKGFAVFFYAC